MGSSQSLGPEERRDSLVAQNSKFYVGVDGQRRCSYIYDPDGCRSVVRIDGEHTYLWFRDPRLDWARAHLLTGSPDDPLRGLEAGQVWTFRTPIKVTIP